MRILFATTQGAGHVMPLVPFARACLRAGHDVAVAGPVPAGRLVRRLGLPFLPVGEPRDRAAAWAPVFAPGGGPAADYVIGELFAGLDARAALPGMLSAVSVWGPDLIVRETCEFASCVAAERFGVPLAQVGIHLASQTDTAEPLLALAAPVLRALGLEDVERLARGPVLTCTPRGIEAGPASERVLRFRAGEARRRAAGAASSRRHAARGAGAELVYVSFGSETPRSPWFPALYRDAAEALADFPLPVLIGVGRDLADLGPLPRNVRAERWVDQAEVSGRAAAIVGHGGSGSTLAALAAGVPLALVPLFVDGPQNARRVAAAGAGIETGVAGLRAAVARLVDEPGYARAAAALADEIAALPPVDAAVDVLAAVPV